MKKFGIKSSTMLLLTSIGFMEVSPIFIIEAFADTVEQTQSYEQSTQESTEPSTGESTQEDAESDSTDSSEGTSSSQEENASEESDTEEVIVDSTTEEQETKQTSEAEEEEKNLTLQQDVQVQNKGWLPSVSDGNQIGTTGQSLRIQAFKLSLNELPKDVTGGISYSAYMQDYGWQAEQSNGAVAGLANGNKRVEAIKVRLTGSVASQYSVYYRVHVQNVGWTKYTKDNAIAGSSNLAYRIEAIQVVLVKNGESAPVDSGKSYPYLYRPNVNYQAHVQNVGWQGTVANGSNAGTSGRSLRMEAVKMSIPNMPTGLTGGITYQAHVQNVGWQNYVSNGAVAGTSGRKLRVEAIRVKLTGELANYFDVQYETHVQGFGWLGWGVNGETAGTSSIGYRMETLKVKLVAKGTAKTPVGAFAHVTQKTGWKSVNGNLKYINAKNNAVIKQFSMPYYSQRDSRWINKKYAGYTLGNTGCGMASMAMIISGFGTTVTPVQTADYAHAYGTFDCYPEVGSAQSDLTMVANRWGLDYKVMSNQNQLATYLSQGYPATVCLDLGNGVRHIVVLRGYSGGYTTVTDPWNGLIFSGRHSISQIWSLLSWKSDNTNRGASAATVFLPR